MKTIRKNFLLLAFAAGALFLIGNNVFAGEDPNESEDPGDGGGGGAFVTCFSRAHPDRINGIGYRHCTECDWVSNADPDYQSRGTCQL